LEIPLFLRALAALSTFGFALAAHAAPAHYLVLHEDASGAVRLVSSRVVDIASIPKVAATRAWNGHGSRAEKRLSVRTVQGGRTVFETDAVTSAELRGEFAGPDGAIQAYRAPLGERDYVVRLPVVPGAHAYVTGPAADMTKRTTSGAALLDLDLDALGSAPRAKAGTSPDTFAVTTTGDPANRLDILIIGDGYTAAQRDKFVQDANTIATQFMSISPYSDYRNAFNFTALFVASNQSGASKPSCPETPGSPVVTVDNALKSTFCTSGIRRLVTVDPQLTFNAASAVPNWDKILVIVNDTEYGGSGGGYSVVTMNSSSVNVAQHEFGHSFTLLADEYSDPYPGYPPCTDAPGTTRPCEPNVTDNLSPVKWAGWITPDTAVPSTQAPSDSRAAGAWEGARYQTSGLYRQCYAGIMRYLGASFCKVDSAAFVNRLYGPGWGAPADGISAIEPGATPEGTSVSAQPGSTMSFQARVLGPAQGVRVRWLVNGQAMQQDQLASGSLASFSYTVPSSPGSVTLEVTDGSSFLLANHASVRTWSIAAAAPPSYPVTVSLGGAGGGRVTSSPAGIDCGATCSMQAGAHSVVTLTASAAQGSRFAGWLGACSGTGACSFTVDAAVSATASFEALQPGAVLVQPSSVDFGSQTLGTTSPASSVTLTNGGQQPLQITGIQASASFALGHDCGTLQPGQQCTARVTFTPATEGAITGTMSISSSAGDRTVTLQGVGERSLVTFFYETILRRAGDQGGKDFWNGEWQRASALGMNPNEAWYAMAASFFASQEYAAFARDDASFVQDLYQTFFNRAPDADGAAYWQGALAKGLTREAAIASFTFSPEFSRFTQARFGDTHVRSEINTVSDFYRGLLARIPDSDGFNFWLGQFRQAQCQGADAVNGAVERISSNFALGSEYANRVRTNAQYVSDLYNAFLRRGGDVDGINYWVDQMATHGRSREDVRRAVMASPEFQNRVSAMVAEGCAG
jgi:hypothetical protein